MRGCPHGLAGLAISLALHGAVLWLWHPAFLEEENIQVIRDIELFSMDVEKKPRPVPPVNKALTKEKRPFKTRRTVKNATRQPLEPVAPREPPAAPMALPVTQTPAHGPEGPAPAAHTTSPAQETQEEGGLTHAERIRCYAGQVRQRIETRKTYPRRAQRQHMEGAVRVRFVLSPEGQVKEITIIRASRFSMLNAAAKKAVLSAAPFPALPEHMNKESISLEVTLSFELT